MRESARFQISVDLLNYGMVSVGLVSGDRIEAIMVDSGEERMEPPRIKQGGLVTVCFWAQLGDPANNEPPGDVSARLANPRMLQ